MFLTILYLVSVAILESTWVYHGSTLEVLRSTLRWAIFLCIFFLRPLWGRLFYNWNWLILDWGWLVMFQGWLFRRLLLYVFCLSPKTIQVSTDPTNPKSSKIIEKLQNPLASLTTSIAMWWKVILYVGYLKPLIFGASISWQTKRPSIWDASCHNNFKLAIYLHIKSFLALKDKYCKSHILKDKYYKLSHNAFV